MRPFPHHYSINATDMSDGVYAPITCRDLGMITKDPKSPRFNSR
jgi:hypothetical protein